MVVCEFDLQATGKKPRLTVEGSIFRQCRVRETGEHALASITRPETLDSKTFEVSPGSTSQKWVFGKTRQRIDGTRQVKHQEDQIEVKCECDIERLPDGVFRTRIRIGNASPKEGTVVQGIEFKLRLGDGNVVVPKIKRPEDVPLYIQTANAPAVLNAARDEIILSPFGTWDEKKLEAVEGAPFADVENGGLDWPEPVPEKEARIYEQAYKDSSRALSKLMPGGKYRLFQEDAKMEILGLLRSQKSERQVSAFVVNTPTASGKSEVNFEAALMAAIVQQEQAPNHDPGTVAIISEPLRALTSEQLERLFDFVAYANEGRQRPITLGYYMGIQSGMPPVPSPDVDISKVPISKCPFCKAALKLEFRQQENRLIPVCTKCTPGREFPWVSLTLKETSESIPNILVATLDKICYDACRNPSVHTFFGRPFVRCIRCRRGHALSRKIMESRAACTCGSTLNPNALQNSLLSLVVLDEAHTFKGGMGAMAGLFLSTELRLAQEALQKGILVVATTATIKNAPQLMKHLTGASETITFPESERATDYFRQLEDKHRKFLFMSACMTNREAIPRTVMHIKKLWTQIRGSNDPERIPQIVFTKKKSNADNLHNMMTGPMMSGQPEQIRSHVIHGETKSDVESVLDQVARCELDVVFTTIDLISLGINIPSIAIVHFDGLDSDYSKFVQAYGRTARRAGDAALVCVWLRRNMPAESYYLEHYRDLFIYQRELLSVVPINRWFPAFVEKYTPAGCLQYSYYTNKAMSFISTFHAARKLRSDDYQKELRKFFYDVFAEPENEEDIRLSKDSVDEGIAFLIKYAEDNLMAHNQTTKDQTEPILPKGIRGNEDPVTVHPMGYTPVMISARVLRELVRSGTWQHGGENND